MLTFLLHKLFSRFINLIFTFWALFLGTTIGNVMCFMNGVNTGLHKQTRQTEYLCIFLGCLWSPLKLTCTRVLTCYFFLSNHEPSDSSALVTFCPQASGLWPQVCGVCIYGHLTIVLTNKFEWLPFTKRCFKCKIDYSWMILCVIIALPSFYRNFAGFWVVHYTTEWLHTAILSWSCTLWVLVVLQGYWLSFRWGQIMRYV